MGVFYFAIRPTTWRTLLVVLVFRGLFRVHPRAAFWWFRISGMLSAAKRCRGWLYGPGR